MFSTRALLLLSYLAFGLGSVSAFSLYPTVDQVSLATALNISIGCLDTLNTTLPCDDDLFQWTVLVDDHWWSDDNLTTLCTSSCEASIKTWELNVASACADDYLTMYGREVPAYTVAGRFTDGLGVACLKSSSSDWCMIESLNWVGSDVVRPDCSNDPKNPACQNPSNVSSEDARITTLYDNSLLCSDCFVKMFYQRLSSDYLPDTDHSDYLVEQFQDILDVCSTTVSAVETRAFFGYPSATLFAGNATTDTAAASSTVVTSTTTLTSTTSAIITPTPTQTGMITSCNKFYQAVSGDSCFQIAQANNINLADFLNWNIAVGTDCTNLWVGYQYCIGAILDTDSSSCQPIDTSIGVTTTDPTEACNQLSLLHGVTTGDLIQYTGQEDCYTPNIVCLPAKCDLMVVPADATCNSTVTTLEEANGQITVTQFLSWNPNIIGTCDSLLQGQYVCASVPGGGYVPPPPPPDLANAGGQERGGPGGVDPTAITGTSISFIVTSQPIGVLPTAPPAPTQLGIPPNCNQYSEAHQGDSCTGFASKNGINPAQLYNWNKVLGSGGANCQLQFWVGYYYCIGTTVLAPTSTSPPTSTGTVVAPTPTQSGIVPNCDLYSQAQNGDYCSKFAQENEISTTQLFKWNSVLGSQGEGCDQKFWAGYYYCVGVAQK